MSSMQLESLANELFLDLFECFNGIDLLRSFHGLNSRFNQLLFIHFYTYRFDLRSISKSDFDLLCHQYLPSILDRIISLKLSNDDETPNLPDLFLSYGFTLNKFIRLQSLSLYSIQSFNQLNQFIFQCHQLSFLTHLYLIDGYNDEDEKKDILFLFNSIWSLAKLQHLYINYNISGRTRFTQMRVTSLSIRYLSMENVACTLEDVSYFIKYTPNLQHLNTTIHFNIDDEQMLIQTLSLSIISLKLTFESSLPVMLKLFQMMPNLQRLSLKTMDIYLNGTKWRKILVNYLFHLKIFQLRMYFEFSQTKTIDEQLEKLRHTFRHPFWIDKHQWFIQCDCIPFGTYHHGILYTLPYAFDTYICYDTQKTKSTCRSKEDKFWTYNDVHSLQYMKYKMSSVDYSQLLPIKFPNIRSLKLGFPFHDQFYSLFPSLNRLKSVEAILGDNYNTEQLQTLIHLSPALYSLRFFYSIDLKVSIAQLTSLSIRRLSFITKCSITIAHFNNEECASLAYSQLGQQCEILLIKIENRSNIIDLIRTMTKLRSLVVHCKDDTWMDKDATAVMKDELIEWLRNSLSTNYLISRDQNETTFVRIWIGDKRNSTIPSY